MKIVFILIFYFINKVACLSELKSTMFFLNAKENALLATSKKPALRYGFHKTEDCKSFDKAFLCIQKCVDLNYDVAHADKHCRCTCYVKQERAKYKPASLATRTRWRSGPPKTSIPYWADANKENKTADEGSESSNEGLTSENTTGTEKLEGDMTGATDSTNLEGGTSGTGGTGVTGATNADGSASTGDTDSTNAGQDADATAGPVAPEEGEATTATAAE